MRRSLASNCVALPVVQQPPKACLLGADDSRKMLDTVAVALPRQRFEAQLRAYLKEMFGTMWFAPRDAGSLLRELWAEGQRMRAEEMLKEVTGSTLEMEAVAERVQEVLA